MAAIWIALTLAVTAGVYTLVDARYLQATPALASASLSQSMAAYRQAGIAYALDNPQASGVVSAAALAPYLAALAASMGSAANPAGAPWTVYVVPNVSVVGSIVVVFTTSTATAAAIAGIEQLAFGSALAGVAYAGTVVSPGNVPVPLPGAIAATVPNGTPVWIAQAY